MPVTKTLCYFIILLLTSEELLSVVTIWVSCAGLTYKFGFALLNPEEKLWRSPHNIPSSTYCKAECQIFVLMYELAQAESEIMLLVPEHTALCCCSRMDDTCFSWAPDFCSFDISEHVWISTMRFVLVQSFASCSSGWNTRLFFSGFPIQSVETTECVMLVMLKSSYLYIFIQL